MILRQNNIKFQIEIFNLQNPHADEIEIEESALHEDSDPEPEYLLSSSVEYTEPSPLKIEFADTTEAVHSENEEFLEELSDTSTKEEPPQTFVKRKLKVQVEEDTHPLLPPTSQQNEILAAYDISIRKEDLNELNNFASGKLNDQKFMNKLLTLVFSKKELAESSVTGNFPSSLF